MEFVPPLRNVGRLDSLVVLAAVRFRSAGGVLEELGFGGVPVDSGESEGESNTSTSATGVADGTNDVRGS